MEASLQSHTVRDLKRILQCVSRFGDELHLQAMHDGLQLSTLNTSKTAFCLFSFGTGAFEKYRLTGSAAQRLAGIKCKLQVKSVLSVLSRSTTSQNILRLDMEIQDPSRGLQGKKNVQNRLRDNGQSSEDEHATSREARLILKLICKHGVIKTHSLNLGHSPFLIATVDPGTLTSRFVIPARTLRDWLDHFNVSGLTTAKGANEANGGINRQESELGWCFEPEQVRVKTWEGGQASKKAISTEIKVATSEFDEYIAETPVYMTFPMREFRAAIALAEGWSIPLAADFSTAGQPISIKIEIESIIAELTIATTEDETMDDQMKANPPSESKSVKRETPRSHPTGEKPLQAQAKTIGKSPARKKASLQMSRDAQANFPQNHSEQEQAYDETMDVTQGGDQDEPLFYPTGSQDMARPMSQAQQMHAASQRELAEMRPDELAGIFEDDDEGLEDNGQNENAYHDQLEERPYKISKTVGNAEEILGKSLLNEEELMDDDDEAPATAHQPEEGESAYQPLFAD